jgi:hypothetical protein
VLLTELHLKYSAALAIIEAADSCYVKMATVSKMISTERDLLSQYSDQKQADITQKWQAVLDRIDTSKATENDESTSLAQLSLGATL